MLMKGSSKHKRAKAELEEVKQEGALRGDVQGYLMDVKRLKQEYAEILAFLQNEKKTATGAAAVGELAQKWRSDDAVQHLTVRLRSRVNNLLWKTIISSLFIRK